MSSIAWKKVNWPLVDSRTTRYQTRIFKASNDNNTLKVRYLQKRLLKSLDAKLMSIRRVTILNKNKKTLKVDQQIFLTDLQKSKLAKKLRLDGKALPIQKVYIDKLNRLEKSSLNLYIVKDRATQALCKLVLEPEWEAHFEPNSYGFRPGRSYHDAMKAIYLSLRNNSRGKVYHKYVLYLDIVKFFDQINSDYLIKKLKTLPEMEKQIKAWLETSILEESLKKKKKINTLENIMDTPQKKVISSLLSNIAFHGIETHMKKWICNKLLYAKINAYNKYAKRKSITFIRYSNNLILIHKEKTIISEAKKEIANWLWEGPRIKFNGEKIFVHNTNNGFNFLGFSVITIMKNNLLRTKIYPSRRSQKLLLLKVRNIMQNNLSTSAYSLINLLYPIIIDWTNYFKYSECSDIFYKLTHFIFQKLRIWIFRRDTRNGKKLVKQRYFQPSKSYTFGGVCHCDNWTLNGKQLAKNGTPRNNWFPHMFWIKNEKWAKIKGIKSPFDRDNFYWKRRIQDKSNWILLQRKIIKLQNGFCPWCKTKFLINLVEKVSYIILYSMNKKDVYTNLQILHKHYHVEKTKIDDFRKQSK